MQLNISSLDYEGRGVARCDGKTVFVHGALPLETVSVHITRSKAAFDEAQTTAVLHPSAYRREPFCPHYRECGGCALQHLEFSAQVAVKQRIFEEQMRRIGKVFPEQMLPPVYGAALHYRSRTRLAFARGQLGYRGKRSHNIIPVSECRILPQAVSEKLPEIRDFLNHMQKNITGNNTYEIEICCGRQIAALNFIGKYRLPEKQLALFAERLNRRSSDTWQIWQQQGQTVQCLIGNASELCYTLPEFDLTMPFRPGDFTQINHGVNEIMVGRAVRLLNPQPDERIADLFCGLGNFTLPLARSGAHTTGMEGSPQLVRRAADNARLNGIRHAVFQTADLFETTAQTVASWGKFDKMLLDPPRAGAYALVQALHAPYLPQKIVYISCNPATLARDAAVLVQKGYRFTAAGIMNLFPHTAHIEAIGVFDHPIN